LEGAHKKKKTNRDTLVRKKKKAKVLNTNVKDWKFEVTFNISSKPEGRDKQNPGRDRPSKVKTGGDIKGGPLPHRIDPWEDGIKEKVKGERRGGNASKTRCGHPPARQG